MHQFYATPRPGFPYGSYYGRWALFTTGPPPPSGAPHTGRICAVAFTFPPAPRTGVPPRGAFLAIKFTNPRSLRGRGVLPHGVFLPVFFSPSRRRRRAPQRAYYAGVFYTAPAPGPQGPPPFFGPLVYEPPPASPPKRVSEGLFPPGPFFLPPPAAEWVAPGVYYAGPRVFDFPPPRGRQPLPPNPPFCHGLCLPRPPPPRGLTPGKVPLGVFDYRPACRPSGAPPHGAIWPPGSHQTPPPPGVSATPPISPPYAPSPPQWALFTGPPYATHVRFTAPPPGVLPHTGPGLPPGLRPPAASAATGSAYRAAISPPRHDLTPPPPAGGSPTFGPIFPLGRFFPPPPPQGPLQARVFRRPPGPPPPGCPTRAIMPFWGRPPPPAPPAEGVSHPGPSPWARSPARSPPRFGAPHGGLCRPMPTTPAPSPAQGAPHTAGAHYGPC